MNEKIKQGEGMRIICIIGWLAVFGLNSYATENNYSQDYSDLIDRMNEARKIQNPFLGEGHAFKDKYTNEELPKIAHAILKYASKNVPKLNEYKIIDVSSTDFNGNYVIFAKSIEGKGMCSITISSSWNSLHEGGSVYMSCIDGNNNLLVNATWKASSVKSIFMDDYLN